MNVAPLALDDLIWADLVEAGRRAIPAASEGRWTLHAPIDPGITLLELFAAELEQRLFVLDQVPDTLVRAVMRVLLGPAAGPRAAQAAVGVLSLDPPGAPVVLPAGSELRQSGADPVVLSTEHAVTAVPKTEVTAVEVAGVNRWPQLRAGDPVAIFGADGRCTATITIKAGAPAGEHRLYLAVEEPYLATGWRPGSQPPARARPVAAPPPRGLGWVDGGGDPVFLDDEGRPRLPDRLGALAVPDRRSPGWQAVIGDRVWPLRVEDGTAGLRVSGILRLRPPPGETFPTTFRLRVSPPDPADPIRPWLCALATNAVAARHRRYVEHHCTATERLLPLPHRELRLGDAAPNADRPLDRVLDGPGLATLVVKAANGTEEAWSAVADLAFSGPADRHFVVDRARGVFRFGDGRSGRILQWPAGTAVRRAYWLGGGVPPPVGRGVGFSAPGGVPATTVTPLGYGQEPEAVAAARARAAQELSASTRAATTADIEAIVRALPGVQVARVHVQPGLDLDHPDIPVPGAATVLCVPAVQRRDQADLAAVPAPELDTWSRDALAAALHRARLVGSLISVRGPAYRDITVTAALDVPAGDRAAVLRRAELVLRQFLDPLVGGPSAGGWPFGAPVQPADLFAVLHRTLGRQAEVTGLRVADARAAQPEWTARDPLPLRPYELPRLGEVNLTGANGSWR